MSRQNAVEAGQTGGLLATQESLEEGARLPSALTKGLESVGEILNGLGRGSSRFLVRNARFIPVAFVILLGASAALGFEKIAIPADRARMSAQGRDEAAIDRSQWSGRASYTGLALVMLATAVIIRPRKNKPEVSKTETKLVSG